MNTCWNIISGIGIYLILATGLESAEEQPISILTDPDFCTVRIYRWAPFKDPRGVLLYEGLTPAIIPASITGNLRAMVVEISRTNYITFIHQYFPPYQKEYSITLTRIASSKPPPQTFVSATNIQSQKPPESIEQKEEQPVQQKPSQNPLEPVVITLQPVSINTSPPSVNPATTHISYDSTITVKPAEIKFTEITRAKTPDFSTFQQQATTLKTVPVNFPSTAITPDISTRADMVSSDQLQQVQPTGLSTGSITVTGAIGPDRTQPVQKTHIDSEKTQITLEVYPVEFALAKICLKENQYEKAIELYQSGIRKYPETENAVLAMTSLVNLWQQDPLLSVNNDFIDEILDIVSKNKNIASHYSFAIGESYLNNGKTDQARKYFQQTLNICPDSSYSAQVPYKMALICVSEQNFPESITWLNKQIEQTPDATIARKAMFLSGSIYLRKLNDYEKAAQAFENYIKKYPDADNIKEAMLNLSACYEQAGDKEKAIQVLKDLLPKYPEENMRRKYIERKIAQLENKD